MKIYHAGTNFEKPEQKRVELNYLIGIKNKTIVISKNSTKCGFAEKTK